MDCNIAWLVYFPLIRIPTGWYMRGGELECWWINGWMIKRVWPPGEGGRHFGHCMYQVARYEVGICNDNRGSNPWLKIQVPLFSSLVAIECTSSDNTKCKGHFDIILRGLPFWEIGTWVLHCILPSQTASLESETMCAIICMASLVRKISHTKPFPALLCCPAACTWHFQVVFLQLEFNNKHRLKQLLL